MPIPFLRAISAVTAALALTVAMAVPVFAQFGPAPVAPKFDDGFRATREVPVNAAPGDPIGDPITATHVNNLAITYSLSGQDASSVDLDAATGQVKVKEGVVLREGDTFSFNVTATDSSNVGALILVTVNVVEAAHHAYDANGNGSIERDEVFAAVTDYFAGNITKTEVVEVIELYFGT